MDNFPLYALAFIGALNIIMIVGIAVIWWRDREEWHRPFGDQECFTCGGFGATEAAKRCSTCNGTGVKQ